MTIDDRTHLPTPEFRDHLEEEVVRAFRHESRFAQNHRRRSLQWMRAAAVVLVSVAIGATAGLAPAQMRDSARRDSLLESAKAELQLAALRLQLARDNLADVKRKVDVGVLGPSSLMNAEMELRAMEARTRREQLDIEEIGATAQPPRNDLNAPLIDGRDFVKDRLQLEALAAQQRLTAAEAAQVDAERRAKVGAGTELSRLDAGNEVERARATLGLLAKRLELRQEFVDKGTPVEQLQRQLELAEARFEAYAAQQQLALARERLAFLEKQQRAGVVSELDVMKANVDVKELELALKNLSARLRVP